MTRALFIAPISVCGPPDSGGAQRTQLLFEALSVRYETDALIVGTGVAPFHKEPFGAAARIYEGLHVSPSGAFPWHLLRAGLPAAAPSSPIRRGVSGGSARRLRRQRSRR